jgi:hypothetical protein
MISCTRSSSSRSNKEVLLDLRPPGMLVGVTATAAETASARRCYAAHILGKNECLHRPLAVACFRDATCSASSYEGCTKVIRLYQAHAARSRIGCVCNGCTCCTLSDEQDFHKHCPWSPGDHRHTASAATCLKADSSWDRASQSCTELVNVDDPAMTGVSRGGQRIADQPTIMVGLQAWACKQGGCTCPFFHARAACAYTTPALLKKTRMPGTSRLPRHTAASPS